MGTVETESPIRSAIARPRLPALRYPLLLVDARAALVAWWRDNAPGMAGMVAFFGFLSVVPLVILLLAFVGDVLGGTASAHDIRRLFSGAVPGLTEKQFLDTYWYPIRHSRVATTILGVVTLLFGTLGLHDSVDWAVNRMWHSGRSRSFWVAKARGLGVIVWATVFCSLSLGMVAAWTVLLSVVHTPSPLASALSALIPSAIVDSAVFAALFKLTPTVPVHWRPAVVAGIISAVLWEISKLGFGVWVLGVASYNRVYGPLAASVIVMLWIWISAMIFLYGAALSASIQCREAGSLPAPESWWYDG